MPNLIHAQSGVLFVHLFDFRHQGLLSFMDFSSQVQTAKDIIPECDVTLVSASGGYFYNAAVFLRMRTLHGNTPISIE